MSTIPEDIFKPPPVEKVGGFRYFLLATMVLVLIGGLVFFVLHRRSAKGNSSVSQVARLVNPQKFEKMIGSGLLITAVNVEKHASTGAATVRLTFQVLGFANDRSRGTAHIHLLQDLETFDPGGKLLKDLSKNGIKELDESGSPENYNYADFVNTLTIPSEFPVGKYTARITVRDQISGKETAQTAEFLIP